MTRSDEPSSILAPQPPGTVRIAARSLPIAKDWALVLISQGIESTLLAGEINGTWLLQISSHQSTRAYQALRLYHLENRRNSWKQAVPGLDGGFDFLSLGWAGLCIWIYWLNSRDAGWSLAGQMDSTKVFSGQYWRMVTAMFLHADLAHLAQNMSLGILLMGLTMGTAGKWPGLLLALLAGAAGNAFSLLLTPKPFIGLGASGVVMGCLGIIATLPLRKLSKQPEGWKKMAVRNAISGAIFLFILFGLSPGTDIFAHSGGFLAGLIIGISYSYLPERVRISNHFQHFCLVVVTGLILGGWWLAWRFH